MIKAIGKEIVIPIRSRSYRTRSKPTLVQLRRSILLVVFLVAIATACNGAIPGSVEPDADSIVEIAAMPTSETDIEWGQFQKDGEFTYGGPIRETVRVYNCNNPSPRSDFLRESRGNEKSVQWNIEGELGLGWDTKLLGMGGEVDAKIASGYELEVTEQIARGRDLELSALPNSAVDYTIEWQTMVWSGYLPFRFQSAEARIRYLYQRHLFGEVKSIQDVTLEVCGHPPTSTLQSPLIAPVDQPATADPVVPTALIAPTTAPPPQPTASVSDAQTISRFEVQAAVMKNRTGLSVTTGDIIHIEYLDGAWTGDSAAAGTTNGCGYRWDDPDPNHTWVFPPEQRGAALVGYIDGTPFYVGCRPVNIVAASSGELYLGMSDCQECFWDNSGSLFALISVRRP